MSKLWGGRFDAEPAPELLAFTQSLSFDRRLAAQDCAVLAAHAHGLARAHVIPEADAAAVADALRAIADEMTAPGYAFDPSDEDVHTAVERALLERLPEIAPKVRAGLSRNDRVATALRLWLLANGRAVVWSIADLVDVLVARAEETRTVLLPGYTHLQRAQPVRLAHHLLAHAYALERDAARFADALRRTDASPLGAGALAGSTLGLDAAASAAALGFSGAMPNSLDAVAARDFVAEFLAAAAICAVHCSRIGEEIVLWTSQEFHFASLSDSFATGSSLMPQKKNPDAAELARGKAGRLIGNLTGLLATLKALPLAYNRDMQEDKEPLLDTVDQMRLLLAAMTQMMRGIRFDVDRMKAAAADGDLLATDLADYLVRHGVPFRAAHDIVGRVVSHAHASGRAVSHLRAEELRDFSGAFGPDVTDALTAAASVEARPAPGPSAASITAQIADLGARVARLRDSVAAPPATL